MRTMLAGSPLAVLGQRLILFVNLGAKITMTRRHAFSVRIVSTLFASALTLVAFGTARTAHASSGTAIGVDLDYTNGINEPHVGSGTGFNVRLGYKLDLLVLQLTPEIGGAYHTFSGDLSPRFSQGIVGGRLQFGKILEPGLYAHLGYGHLSSDHFDSYSGATADAGLTLDLTLLPLLDVGVHAGYNGMLKSGDRPAFDSYVLGAHAALVF
jgi:hypothetical protein